MSLPGNPMHDFQNQNAYKKFADSGKLALPLFLPDLKCGFPIIAKKGGEF
jgi:hypothetical protein